MPPLDELLSALRSLKNPIVMGHENADVDAVASAYALSRFLSCDFGFPGDVSREGRALLRYLDTPYELNPSVNGRDVVVVDTGMRDMLGEVEIEEASTVVVIDHHTSEPDIKGYHFIFPVSSTSEIVHDVLVKAGYDMDEKIRISLALGIVTDTAGLQVADADTLRKVAGLLGNRVVADILEIIRYEEDVSERIARLKALRKGEIYRLGDFLVAVVEAGSFEGSVAKVLVQAGADVGIAYTESSELDRISIRLSRRAVRMGFSGEELLSGLQPFGARCGGHPGAAGCRLPPGRARNASKYLVDLIVRALRERGLQFDVRQY